MSENNLEIPFPLFDDPRLHSLPKDFRERNGWYCITQEEAQEFMRLREQVKIMREVLETISKEDYDGYAWRLAKEALEKMNK